MKSWLIPGLMITGALIIVASLVFPNKTLRFLDRKFIAQVVEVNGRVSAQGLDQIDSIQLKPEDSIKNMDILHSEPESDALFMIPEIGGEFRITENSEVLVEKQDDGSVIVSIRQGDVLVENFGKKPSYWIRKDGRQMTAMDYALSSEKNAALFKNKAKINTEISQLGRSDTLSQNQIEEILVAKKSDFFRCYGQLIQKDEQAHGQMLLSFEINNLGKVTKVDFTKEDMTDSTFKSCLSEVVFRTQFPRFSGAAVTTVFPLKFE